MDNLEMNLKNIQDQITGLEKRLSEAQNQKLTAEVHLQNEQKELDALQQQLMQMTGLSSIDEVQNYIISKSAELDSIMNDLQTVSSCINSQYTFADSDVNAIKDIINKYNIPIGE